MGDEKKAGSSKADGGKATQAKPRSSSKKSGKKKAKRDRKSKRTGETGRRSARGANAAPRRERRNFLIHHLYVRREFRQCEKVLAQQLKDTDGRSEYALFVKALVRRQQGKIHESLQLFQETAMLNPHNVLVMKQIGRSLFLLGKHHAALEVYDDALVAQPKDWEIYFNKGVCYVYLKQFAEAIDCFEKANGVHRQDVTYMQIGRVYTMQEKYKAAVEVYLEALDFSPENPELLTTIGLLFLRLNESNRAFEYLGNALTHDPKNAKTILAAGSIIQDFGDTDVALVKYRVAAVATPNSAQLWNNVGMCFFAKSNLVAAVACLKRALFLAPFEWLICHNLGLVHLAGSQFASAFHFFSAAINFKADYAPTFMFLGVVLMRLGDEANAVQAYEKALALDATDYLTHLNYAISLCRMDGKKELASKHYDTFLGLFRKLDDKDKQSDPDVLEQKAVLEAALKKK